MTPANECSSLKRKKWIAPRLEKLAADLSCVAGSNFPPGDGNSGSGKSLVPPVS